MENRRQFIKKITGLFSGITVLSSILPSFLKSINGKESNILLAAGRMDKDMEAVSSNPISSQIAKVTPLESFGVMGKTDIEVSKDEWNLEIDSSEGNLLKYTYDEILEMPSFEKEVVLDCPGVFKNYGLWKGISLGTILEENGLVEGIKKVKISGLNGKKDMSLDFPVKSILNDRIFLCYGVNREILPVRNGFPLRAVALDYNGGYWIKYVYRVTLIS